MKYLIHICALVMLTGISCKAKKKGNGARLEEGVSLDLAQHRKSILSNISYQLTFDIPADKKDPIPVKETIHFVWQDSLSAPLQIDYKPLTSGIRKMIVNGEPAVPNFQKEHLLIDVGQLKTGVNQIDFELDAGEGALNRKSDYLYTLFVPDRARTAFPCFDQPDLKATFDLSLTLPAGWNAMANGSLKDSVLNGDRKTLHFRTSDTLSTYLFAFTAGVFTPFTAKVGNRQARLLYRENDSAKIAGSLKAIYSLSSHAIDFYQKWTGIAYPFQKLGMTAIPNFQFGGMEHPGNIFYQSSSLFLDAGATKGQLNNRSNLLSHELAHMWFGDLVTMRWFNDVWMKEVFANFMADKCTRPAGSEAGFTQKFLIDHYPAAFSEDRTPGANPIRQPLDNLQNAGMLYGNIIYHKAPIMMQQLEKIMGPAAFQKGVRTYLKKYAWRNASWPDLIKILNKNSTIDLLKWNEVWVNESGRPVFDYSMKTSNGRITSFILHQQPENNTGKQRRDPTAVWPQVFDIELYYPEGVKRMGIRDNSAQMDVKAAIGLKKPLFILWNATGMGYGLWPADTLLSANLYRIKDVTGRASAYINLYENMLAGRALTAGQLLKSYTRALSFEKDELNIKLLTGYIPTLFWEFTTPKERSAIGPTLETALWQAQMHDPKSNNKKLLFNAYVDIFTSSGALGRLKGIFDARKPPQGINLYEEDYIDLALQLALREQDNQVLLATELKRIKNEDRIERFKIVMRAASSDEKTRDDFFQGLLNKDNRGNESAIIQALSYLHHPLRQPASEKYLKPSLALLEEIQQTGDIFFPKSWLSATFGYYQSNAAMEIIGAFLKRHDNYNEKLKDKILQATDDLRRSLLLQQKTISIRKQS